MRRVKPVALRVQECSEARGGCLKHSNETEVSVRAPDTAQDEVALLPKPYTLNPEP